METFLYCVGFEHMSRSKVSFKHIGVGHLCFVKEDTST